MGWGVRSRPQVNPEFLGRCLPDPATFLPEAGGWGASPHWSPACCSGPRPYGGLQVPTTGRHPNPKTEQGGAEPTEPSPLRGARCPSSHCRSLHWSPCGDSQPSAFPGLGSGEEARGFRGTQTPPAAPPTGWPTSCGLEDGAGEVSAVKGRPQRGHPRGVASTPAVARSPGNFDLRGLGGWKPEGRKDLGSDPRKDLLGATGNAG